MRVRCFDDETVDYILKAVDFVARRGAEFLPSYRLDAASARLWYGRDVVDPGDAARQQERRPLAAL